MSTEAKIGIAIVILCILCLCSSSSALLGYFGYEKYHTTTAESFNPNVTDYDNDSEQ
jgi:hypothetical protein